jgi:hypothetical protein
MDRKILNDKYRIMFIQGADFKTLNEYLKNMEKLSKKGGQFLEIYNKDMDYLLNNDILGGGGPDSLNIFFGNTEIPIGNTETNIQHINKITNNITQNDMVQKLTELNNIETCIRNEYDTYGDKSITNSTKKFIDIIMRCTSIDLNDEHTRNLINSFKIITSLIKDNKMAVREGYKYFSIILSKNKNKIIIEFCRDLKSLHNEKNKMPLPEYKQKKDELIKNSIMIYGIDCILTSILFNKIYNEYKKK